MNVCCTFLRRQVRLTVSTYRRCYCERVCASLWLIRLVLAPLPLPWELLPARGWCFYTRPAQANHIRCPRTCPKVAVCKAILHTNAWCCVHQLLDQRQSFKIQLNCSVTMGTAFNWKERNNESGFWIGKLSVIVPDKHIFAREKKLFQSFFFSRNILWFPGGPQDSSGTFSSIDDIKCENTI